MLWIIYKKNISSIQLKDSIHYSFLQSLFLALTSHSLVNYSSSINDQAIWAFAHNCLAIQKSPPWMPSLRTELDHCKPNFVIAVDMPIPRSKHFINNSRSMLSTHSKHKSDARRKPSESSAQTKKNPSKTTDLGIDWSMKEVENCTTMINLQFWFRSYFLV